MRQRWLIRSGGVSILLLVAVAVVTAYTHWIRPPLLPAGLIQANGRMEGDEILVAAKSAGRIRELLVREGATVRRRDVVARLDDEQITARVNQAQAAVAQAIAQVQQARETVAKADAMEQQAHRDADRFQQLAARGTVSRRQGEEAALAWTAAARDLSLAKSSLNQATAGVAGARAMLAEARSVRADLELVAPSTGTVMTRVRNEGEVVSAGAPVVTLVDLDQLYLKVYVSEREIGMLRLGLPARIYTDAYPNAPFPAHVGAIASDAEFTPKEVQTPDERVKLVFAVKLYVDANPGHRLMPGMPADAVIRWQAEAPWVKPRW